MHHNIMHALGNAGVSPNKYKKLFLIQHNRQGLAAGQRFALDGFHRQILQRGKAHFRLNLSAIAAVGPLPQKKSASTKSFDDLNP